MVKLLTNEVHSKEVLGWSGLHLFHATLSSCSQKTRIFLSEKEIPWTSHPIDLGANENISDFYLGINPRGLVPALVDEGTVHIESNDIILHLEGKFPEPCLIPTEAQLSLQEMLQEEDELHPDIRNVTFRFIFEPPVAPKSEEDLERYARMGSPTVGGKKDDQKAKEIAYWRAYGNHRVSDEDARQSVNTLRGALQHLDARLEDAPFLLGSDISIADIAWFVVANRMQIAGYPLGYLHPNMLPWYERLAERPHWTEETSAPPPFVDIVRQHQERLAIQGRRLIDICDLAEVGSAL